MTTTNKTPSVKLSPPQSEEKSALPSLIAGFCGGSVSTVLLYPLDLIKVRLQVNEEPVTIFGTRRPSDNQKGEPATAVSKQQQQQRPQQQHHRRNFIFNLRNVVRHEGFFGLYQGLTPAIIGSAVSWGGYFFFYETLKSELVRQKTAARLPSASDDDTTAAAKVKLGATENFFAACSASAAMVVLTNPIWLIKTRMQLQITRNVTASSSVAVGVLPKQYGGVVDAFATIVREEGVLGLYKGSLPAMMLVSHGGVQFVAYEFLKNNFGTYKKVVMNRRAGQVISMRERLYDSLGYLTMGAIAKIIASTTTYPIQVIKSRIQQRSQSLQLTESGDVQVVKRNYKGVVDCCTRIWRNEGFVGFYKGCVPNALRVAPSAAITFVVYEGVVDLLMGDDHRF